MRSFEDMKLMSSVSDSSMSLRSTSHKDLKKEYKVPKAVRHSQGMHATDFQTGRDLVQTAGLDR